MPLINRGALFPTMVFLTYTITTAPVRHLSAAACREPGSRQPRPVLHHERDDIDGFDGDLRTGLGQGRTGAVIVPGLLVVASSMFILTTAHERWLFLAAGVLSGLGFGMIQVAMQALTVGRVPARERSSALATLQSAWDLGRIGRGVHLWATGVGNRGRGDFRNRGRRHGAWGHRLRGGQREVFPEGDHAGVRRSAASKSAICRSGDALRRDTSSSNSAISRTALQMALATSSGSAMPSITIHLSGSSRASSR